MGDQGESKTAAPGSACTKEATCSLIQVSAGFKGKVVAIEGGVKCRSRVTSMGLKTGCQIEVLRSSDGARGPLLVAVGASRLGIGRGMAEKIVVQAETE